MNILTFTPNIFDLLALLMAKSQRFYSSRISPVTSQTDQSGAHRALNQLLQAVAPTMAQQTSAMAEDPGARLSRCIELLKVQASEAASLVADCAPQGRPMLADAQHKLECLENLKLLETIVNGTNNRNN